MKGQKAFVDNALKYIPPKQTKRGRNDELIEKRNECLLARYFYYSRFSGLCYEESMARIAKEFFLTPSRITRIIQDNAESLQELRQNQTTIYYLQTHYPHLKWWV